MFDHVELLRPDLAVDPKHDGRHKLGVDSFGRTDLYGYVYKDGLMAEITDVFIDWQGEDQSIRVYLVAEIIFLNL